jgi:hypothetical protein
MAAVTPVCENNTPTRHVISCCPYFSGTFSQML